MNVLITGVTKGLGLETSEILLEKGYNVYGIGRTYTNKLTNIMNTYEKSFKFLQYDLSDSESIPKVIFKDWLGMETPIHAFVNNAAVAYDDIVTNLNISELKKMYDINVFSPLLITKHVVRQMLLHNVSGSIVHISSISAHTGYKGLSMYASTKGALESFSKNISREWGERDIRSNSIVVGFMDTDMSSLLSADQKTRIYQRTSLKKGVEIQSVAQTIEFLISDRSKSITGQNIHVDNGTI
jgi:3-oxoacyl-[acyl-carrier protein] reductase